MSHITNVCRGLEQPGVCHYERCLPEDLRLDEVTQWAAVRGVGFFVGDFICFTPNWSEVRNQQTEIAGNDFLANVGAGFLPKPTHSHAMCPSPRVCSAQLKACHAAGSPGSDSNTHQVCSVCVCVCQPLAGSLRSKLHRPN